MSQDNEDENIKIPAFIRKLWGEVCDISNTHIRFDKHGDRIVIPDREQFIKHSMAKITNSKDYSGFVRALNMYGFCKIQLENETGDYYYNSLFTLNDPFKLGEIQRDQKSFTKESLPAIINNLRYLGEENQQLRSEIYNLKSRMANLEKQNQNLFDIVVGAFRAGMRHYYPEEKVINQLSSPQNTTTIVKNSPKTGDSSEDDKKDKWDLINANFHF